MLTSILRTIINKSYYESFNITFMENIKMCQKKLIVLSFFKKMFLKIITKPIFLRNLLTFPQIEI